VTMMLTVVAAAAGSVGCEGAPVESRARPSVPADTPTTVRPDPILTFGPESLHVAFVDAPDSLSVWDQIGVTVAAYNFTNGRVALRLACAASGFQVRVVDTRGSAHDLARPSCGADSTPRLIPLAPGDS